MITGVVNVKGEAILRVVVSDLATQRIVIDAVIDTGYNGFLTLPSSDDRAVSIPL
jgi:predicted aspartyl protease